MDVLFYPLFILKSFPRLFCHKPLYNYCLREIRHFKNDNLVKKEDSFEGIKKYQYDSNGNLISVTGNARRTEYEYNSDNNITKRLFYENNQFRSYTKNIYEDTLLVKSYSINNLNDTIGYSYYYYNSANMIDSVISHHVNRYYYSEEMDSIIIKSKENELRLKEFKKHESGRLTYNETRSFYEGELGRIKKTTNEFNDKGLLTRRIKEDIKVIPNVTLFSDTRFFYNSNDNILKSEEYDEANNLLYYRNYIYEDSKLTKVETFDHDDNLNTYSIVENNCDNKVIMPMWYSQP